MAIPDFDHNLVLPPHLGSPVQFSDLSPYPCSTVELVDKFATSPERKAILDGFLKFRERLRTEGLRQGFQWLDGSFLEDIETQEGRAPNDLDLVTIYWGYDLAFQQGLAQRFPEFGSPQLSKANYLVDHYPLDASFQPANTVEMSRYWAQLFSHNRQGVWKGMLRIDLDTDSDDSLAAQKLQQL
ncbi:DUF6932 family protein [Roseibacillus persicicus]|uniref:Uncharacterized protein n=1 Tax=Roseibacillus persicicus TaxID=454148 RepID=A0A918WJW2_9BACT|nr:hypothetical protein [Roseibacillus persicicus]GHC54365.1 hypothetical protein GCM10007100_20960 [Roseibacillus persicicus]